MNASSGVHNRSIFSRWDDAVDVCWEEEKKRKEKKKAG
jgi:hypothetical protein